MGCTYHGICIEEQEGDSPLKAFSKLKESMARNMEQGSPIYKSRLGRHVFDCPERDDYIKYSITEFERADIEPGESVWGRIGRSTYMFGAIDER